jgi:hypothetical protein
VHPVPDPFLLRKSGSAENRTRDLWICSQKLSPLDHSGGPQEYNICTKVIGLYTGNSLLCFGKDLLRTIMLQYKITYYYMGRFGQPWTESWQKWHKDCLSQFRVAWLICVWTSIEEGKSQETTLIEGRVPCETPHKNKNEGSGKLPDSPHSLTETNDSQYDRINARKCSKLKKLTT